MAINLSQIGKSVAKSFKKASPHILTGVGVVGFTVAAVTAVGVTPKALELIELEAINSGIRPEDMTFREKAKAAWKVYIVPAAIGVGAVVCVVGGHVMLVKEIHNLGNLLAASESALVAFKDEAIEALGQDKVQEIEKKAVEEQVKAREDAGTMPETPSGHIKVAEDILGQETDMKNVDEIMTRINRLNKKLLEDGELTVQDYAEEFGLREPADGFNRVWELGDRRSDGLLDVRVVTDWSLDMRTPLVLIQHKVRPHDRRRSR